MSKPTSNFSKRLKEFMEQNHFSQVDIVARTGIPNGTISKYLSGKQEPKADKIDAIARAFGLNHAWLLGYDYPQSTNDLSLLIEVTEKKADSNAHLLAYAAKLGKLSDDDRKIIEGMIDRLSGGDSNGKKEV